MNAGYASDGVAQGQFVLISTGSVENADNAKLYVKGAAKYEFLVDMSGATGIQGPQGVQGVQGPQGAQGEKGNPGDTGPRGPQGVQGETGAKGDPGKSAYTTAKEAGYSGTEAEFAAALSQIANHIASKANPHGVTAAQVGALPLSGGTLTGNLTGKYIIGTWLQSTAASALGSAATKICVLDSSGWVYYRTAEQIRSDIGASKPSVAFTVTLSSSGWSSNAQTVSDSRFVVSGYAYTVCPAGGSFSAYSSAVIYAEDVSTAGKMVFHCAETPTANLTVNIMRVEVS